MSTFDSLNPADGSVLASFPAYDDVEVAAAVARAREAAPWWAGLGFEGRKARLLAFKRRIVAGLDELARLMQEETGKPVDDSRLEVMAAVEHVDWAARNAHPVLRKTSVRPGLLGANLAASVEHVPLGVVGVIGPWNYPVFTPMGSIAYALAAGNSVVFKPSEYSTAVGLWIVDAFATAVPELPVLQAVTGLGATGSALCRAGVNKLAFTGSTATGKKVMAACAETLTPVVIEAGGKDAAIIAADADIRAAAQDVAFGAWGNAGQTCIGMERAYVEAPVFEAFVAELRRIAAGVTVGAGPQDRMGPLTMPSQPDTVLRHIRAALDDGGRAVVGGEDSVRPPFVSPVILLDVPEDSAAVREETFGPTLTVTRVDSLEEAVSKSNAGVYGLGSAVYSRNLRTAETVARRLRAGMTSINSVMSFALVPALPFGGTGDSGFGRIHGADGLREFTRPHSVARQRFPLPVPLLSFQRKPWHVKALARAVRLVHGRR
ncbi:aldehyde dehydrogenase family protein [Arthrobacter sp. NPDC090010]|uniref:aldehyde dehydrogenase family protein n=1 Tax=Arthrobacter sp. NPDC090010 TaxID=3363942 RepID=UPI003814D981